MTLLTNVIHTFGLNTLHGEASLRNLVIDTPFLRSTPRAVTSTRSAETAAAWIASHPEIELVSRDRGGDYASAAATGAPQAVQCADRFHMMKNLGEALEGCLARHLAAKRQKQIQEIVDEHRSIEHAPRAVRRSPKVERFQQAYRAER